MPLESDKWGWKHVTVFGGFDKGSGTKRWKCNHCNLRYNGSYSRVRAHLLGFTGVGVKSCPAIDKSLRDAFQILEEERLARKKKRTSRNGESGKRIRTARQTPAHVAKDDVDEVLARFFYAHGLNLYGVNSPYFQDMVKAVAAAGPSYETPSADELCNSLLAKEKGKIERAMVLIRETWSRTGCTVLCIGHLEGILRYLRISVFVSSPRGVSFLKAVDIEDAGELDHVLTSVLGDVIIDIGPKNVLQIISHLGETNKYSESLILSKFPHIFWSSCTSHSIYMFIEEIAELHWIKPVVLCAKEIEQLFITYQHTSSIINQNLKGNMDPWSTKFAPSYSLVERIFEMRQSLQEVVDCEKWKQWKLSDMDSVAKIEAAIRGDDFWITAHLFLQLCEPFVRPLSVIDVDKSVMGDIIDWKVQALEALKRKGIDEAVVTQLEQHIESRWDALFSPLHSAGYILNPKYAGKDQGKDKIVMRGWKATLETYECDGAARRNLREQLSSYWRSEGALGEEDAIDCRDKIDPVAWWENFGFETPELQTLAIKILSQVSTVSICQEVWQDNDFPCPVKEHKLGLGRPEDLVFVRSNLRLNAARYGVPSSSCAQKIVIPRARTLNAGLVDQTSEITNGHGSF